jgi:hypothetical protein
MKAPLARGTKRGAVGVALLEPGETAPCAAVAAGEIVTVVQKREAPPGCWRRVGLMRGIAR